MFDRVLFSTHGFNGLFVQLDEVWLFVVCVLSNKDAD